MLRSVSFNNQAVFKINKINYVVANLLLPFELETGQAMTAQDRPDTAFSFGGVAPHLLGAVEQALAPSPWPLRDLSLSRKGRGSR